MSASVLILPVSYYAYAVKRFKNRGQSISWLYLGKDFSAVNPLENKLPSHFRQIIAVKLHNIVAERIRKPFIDWLDELNDLRGANKEWWFESVSCRNVYESDLFQNCCYVEIIKGIFSQNSLELPTIIFVDSEGLANVLAAWLRQERVKVILYRHFFIGKTIKRSLSSLHNYCFFICQLLSRFMAALFTRAHGQQKKTILGHPRILIDTFIHANSFQDDNSFYDPYYPGLYQFLESKGYSIMIHPVLDIARMNFYSLYKQMRKSNYQFVLPEDYLRLRDYASIILYPLRFFSRGIKTMPFLGIDITPLIKEERRFALFSGPMYAVLIYRFFMRFKQNQPSPEIILDWYENQVIDRAFIFGAREAFPKAKLIGVQMFMHSLNFLNHFPTKTEVRFRVVPDTVLCVSKLQCEMAKAFSDGFRCLPCAALRSAHVFDNLPDIDQDVIKKNILVLLPYIHDEALELLSLVREAKKLLAQDIAIRIKSHPFLDMDSLSLRIGEWPGQICDKTLKEEFSRALVVVGTHSSSLVEALACNRPVIFVARQNCFSHNPLVAIPDGIARVCYSFSDLASALTYYYSLSLSERSRFKAESLRIRDLYFTPVSEETLEPFLGN